MLPSTSPTMFSPGSSSSSGGMGNSSPSSTTTTMNGQPTSSQPISVSTSSTPPTDASPATTNGTTGASSTPIQIVSKNNPISNLSQPSLYSQPLLATSPPSFINPPPLVGSSSTNNPVSANNFIFPTSGLLTVSSMTALSSFNNGSTPNQQSTVVVTTRDETSVYGQFTKTVDKSDTYRNVSYSNVNRLATDFGFLIDNEELSDVQLRSGMGKTQRTFHCHKLILCQRSEYFRNMFLVHRGMFAESTPLSTPSNLPFGGGGEVLTNSFGTRISVVEKPNIAPAVFEKVLQYIYTGRVTFTTKLKHRRIKDKTVHVAQLASNDDIDNVISMCMHVLAAADELILLELKNFCVDYVKQYIDSESAIVLLDLALKYGSEDLIESCFDFIKHNAREVIASESLPFVSRETMKLFLDSEYLAVDEIEIFRSLLRWGLAEVENTHGDEEDGTSIVNGEEQDSSDSEGDFEDITNPESIDPKRLLEMLSQPPEEEEDIFKKKSKAMTKKTMLLSDYFSDADEEEMDLTTPFEVVRNPLRDDISIHTKFSLDPVPQNRHHTDLIQLSNRLSDDDKLLLREAVKDLVQCIRFPLMTPHQLTDVVETFSIVEDSLLLEAYRHVCAPDRSTQILNKRYQKRKGASDTEQSHFHGSTILKTKLKQELIKMCGEQTSTKGKLWTLAFKATKDGWDSNVFHQKVDQRGPSVLVCRTTEGYIFGGFNSVEWNSNNQWVKASDTFLFSLVNPYNDGPRKLKVKNPQRAVYCHASSGPSFGGGTNLVFDPYDLYLDSTMKRGHTNVGGAYSTFRGGFRSDEAQKSLAGSLNAWILGEVEVFILN